MDLDQEVEKVCLVAAASALAAQVGRRNRLSRARSWREAMSAIGRWVAVATMAAGLAACTVGGSSPRPTSTAVASHPASSGYRTFADDELTFRYSASLVPSTWEDVSTMTWPIVYLSAQRAHDPCSTTRAADGQVVAEGCGVPITALVPGGSLIHWYNSAFPGETLDDRLGTAGEFAGHPARIRTGAADDPCQQLGGSRSVEVVIDPGRASPVGVLIRMDACLSRADQVASVLTMLDSLRVLNAPQ